VRSGGQEKMTTLEASFFVRSGGQEKMTTL
jgi:hypothetical protein